MARPITKRSFGFRDAMTVRRGCQPQPATCTATRRHKPQSYIVSTMNVAAPAANLQLNSPSGCEIRPPKLHAADLTERAAAQSHFRDVCDLLVAIRGDDVRRIISARRASHRERAVYSLQT